MHLTSFEIGFKRFGIKAKIAIRLGHYNRA